MRKLSIEGQVLVFESLAIFEDSPPITYNQGNPCNKSALCDN